MNKITTLILGIAVLRASALLSQSMVTSTFDISITQVRGDSVDMAFSFHPLTIAGSAIPYVVEWKALVPFVSSEPTPVECVDIICTASKLRTSQFVVMDSTSLLRVLSDFTPFHDSIIQVRHIHFNGFITDTVYTDSVGLKDIHIKGVSLRSLRNASNADRLMLYYVYVPSDVEENKLIPRVIFASNWFVLPR